MPSMQHPRPSAARQQARGFRLRLRPLGWLHQTPACFPRLAAAHSPAAAHRLLFWHSIALLALNCTHPQVKGVLNTVTAQCEVTGELNKVGMLSSGKIK